MKQLKKIFEALVNVNGSKEMSIEKQVMCLLKMEKPKHPGVRVGAD